MEHIGILRPMAKLCNSPIRVPMIRHTASAWLFVLLSAAILIGCGGQTSVKSKPKPNAGPIVVPGAPLAQDWKTTNGHDVRLVDYRGRVVFVVYFTTWCVPCVQVMDDLHRLVVSELPENALQVIAVSLDLEPQKVIPAFMETLELAYPIVLPDAGALRGKTPFGKVPAVPTLFVLDSKGRHVETLVGAIPTDYLKRRVQARGVIE